MRWNSLEGINWNADGSYQTQRRSTGRDDAPRLGSGRPERQSKDGAAGLGVRGMSPTDDATAQLQRMRAEFREMPGLTLTAAQATRLWQLDPLRSEELLNSLVVDGLLRRNNDGAYLVSSDPVLVRKQ